MNLVGTEQEPERKPAQGATASPMDRLMIWTLRSPFQRIISGSIMLITFTGRKTGRTYTTPVSYLQEGNQVTMFTRASWWRNLQAGARVTLRVRGRDVQGFAEPCAEDRRAVVLGVVHYLQWRPGEARFYQVAVDPKGEPRREEVERTSQGLVMIRIKL